MSPELDKLLCEKYPIIFKDRHESITRTAMVWGFSCEDGWFALLDVMCDALMQDHDRAKSDLESAERCLRDGISPTYYTEEYLEKCKKKYEEELAMVPVAIQVKEKYGTLRFYYYGGNLNTDSIVSAFEMMSAHTCETCGMTKDARRYTDGWFKTLCPSCATEQGRSLDEDDEDE